MDDEESISSPTPTTAANIGKLPPPPTSKTDNSKCDYCTNKCQTLLRCTRCRQAHYCSKTCQRSDWKVHKRVCTPVPHPNDGDKTTTTQPKKPTAIEAARELSALLGGLSIGEATERYHRANDEVKRLVGTETESVGKTRGGNSRNGGGMMDPPVFGPLRP